jgi:predicted nucleic acid-binding Zn ribbon protein
VRRRAPRPLSAALERLGHSAAPQTVLARVQAAWSEAVGPAIAAEAQPIAERAGTVTIACRSAAWASELELLAPDLLEKLNAALGDGAEGPLTGLRARVAELP